MALLIRITRCRLHEALELVKDMARSHRYVQSHPIGIQFSTDTTDRIVFESTISTYTYVTHVSLNLMDYSTTACVQWRPYCSRPYSSCKCSQKTSWHLALCTQVHAGCDAEQPGARSGTKQRCTRSAHGLLHDHDGLAHLPPHQYSPRWCLRTPAPVCRGI